MVTETHCHLYDTFDVREIHEEKYKGWISMDVWQLMESITFIVNSNIACSSFNSSLWLSEILIFHASWTRMCLHLAVLLLHFYFIIWMKYSYSTVPGKNFSKLMQRMLGKKKCGSLAEGTQQCIISMYLRDQTGQLTIK